MNSDTKIEFLNRKDIKSFFLFINDNWKKNYIFIKNKIFFDWQFYNSKRNTYNFVIAKQNEKIVGCLGFILNNNYSKTFKKKDYIWLVNWHVIDKYKHLSLKLIEFLLKKNKYHFIGTIGCTKKTQKILKALRFDIGTLIHVACQNDSQKKFCLSKFKRNKSKIKAKKKMKIKKINKSEIKNFFRILKPINLKNEEYFLKRYFTHPSYKYIAYGLYENNIRLGFFICRECRFKNAKSLKMIDYHGNRLDLSNFFSNFKNILSINNYEFIDFYFYSKENFYNYKNYILKKKEVVPNYFEPFIKKNIKIRFAFQTFDKFFNPFFVRGDCDQDRPN
ncbi:hypothetical protein [Candidatus Pelagibacter sp.]|uniref:hypothetical protein n=1 Tax=Candidatus Pelagibacter sp. TaxID=2024849 RepID=UPI003F831FE3